MNHRISEVFSNPSKKAFLISGYTALFLIILWGVGVSLNRRQRQEYERLTKSLNFEGVILDGNTLSNMQKVAGKSAEEFSGVINIFDPRKEHVKKGYDPSIFFVEELKNITKALAREAQNKQLTLPPLGFKEELPSEAGAVDLLKQLYCLQKIVKSGLDNRVNFTRIQPEELPKKEGAEKKFKPLYMNFEFGCLSGDFIEFLAAITAKRPLILIDSLGISDFESNLKVKMRIEHLVIDDNIFVPQELKPVDLSIQEEEEQGFISLLRAADPFFVPSAVSPAAEAEKSAEEKEAPKTQRFFYRGIVVFRGREKAVIEDSLKNETIFVDVGAPVDGYILVEINKEKALIRHSETGDEIVLFKNEPEAQSQEKK